MNEQCILPGNNFCFKTDWGWKDLIDPYEFESSIVFTYIFTEQQSPFCLCVHTDLKASYGPISMQQALAIPSVTHSKNAVYCSTVLLLTTTDEGGPLSGRSLDCSKKIAGQINENEGIPCLSIRLLPLHEPFFDCGHLQ